VADVDRDAGSKYRLWQPQRRARQENPNQC
jgi:hypothetical protein